MSDFNVEEYVNKLFEGETGEEVEVAKKALLARTNVAARVKDTAMMRSDYSRVMDEHKKLKAAENDIKEALVWVEKQKAVNYNNQEYVEALSAEKAKLEAELAQVKASQGDTTLDLKTYKSELEARMEADKQETQLAGITLMATAIDLTQDFHEKYGKRLNAKELFDKAMTEKKTVKQVYEEIEAPLKAEKAEKDIQAKIEAARKEEREAVLSKLGSPEIATKVSTPVMSILSKKPAEVSSDPATRVSKAVAAFTKLRNASSQ